MDDETTQIGRNFVKVSDLQAGLEINARAAILHDCDGPWSLDWLRQDQDFDYVQHFRHYYKPLVARNIPEGIISADESLDGFWLVIAPGLVILTPEKAQQLTEFV